MTELTRHFQLLSRYNRIANEGLYAACAELGDAEYRKQRAGSFGSIHALLNHILLGDRRWLALFEQGKRETPALGQILYDEFPALREARAREDARLEAFFATLEDGFWSRSFPYINNKGKDYVETAHVACAHLFNHQTHHRGQVHVMLAQTPVVPPSLDLHRSINP